MEGIVNYLAYHYLKRSKLKSQKVDFLQVKNDRILEEWYSNNTKITSTIRI